MQLEQMANQVEDALRQSGAHVHRAVLYRDGEYIQRTLAEVSPCCNCYSISKVFTSTAVGIAADKGLLRVEDRVEKYLGTYFPENAEEYLHEVTLWNLLTHTMGIETGFLFEGDRGKLDTDDWLRESLSRPLTHRPGTHFAYSNSTYYLLSCIVETVTGQPMALFLRDNMLRHMGVVDYAWEECPRGHTMGATGLYISTMDMARLGVMYLGKGVYEEQRLLSEEWVGQATRIQADFGGHRYGYGFTSHEGGWYTGNGANNQFLAVMPDAGVVLAIHSFERERDLGEVVIGLVRDVLMQG